MSKNVLQMHKIKISENKILRWLQIEVVEITNLGARIPQNMFGWRWLLIIDFCTPPSLNPLPAWIKHLLYFDETFLETFWQDLIFLINISLITYKRCLLKILKLFMRVNQDLFYSDDMQNLMKKNLVFSNVFSFYTNKHNGTETDFKILTLSVDI